MSYAEKEKNENINMSGQLANDFERNVLNSLAVTEGITAYPLASEITVKWAVNSSV